MNLNQYQTLAARTIGCDDKGDMRIHALLGLGSENGELASALLKSSSKEYAVRELGDIMWMVAELCTSYGWYLHDIAGDISEYRGMRSEYYQLSEAIGQLLGLYQKTYQGHELLSADVRAGIRNVYRQVTSVANSIGVTMDTVMWTNIEKLRARYPDGFDPERSVHRAEDDV